MRSSSKDLHIIYDESEDLPDEYCEDTDQTVQLKLEIKRLQEKVEQLSRSNGELSRSNNTLQDQLRSLRICSDATDQRVLSSFLSFTTGTSAPTRNDSTSSLQFLTTLHDSSDSPSSTPSDPSPRLNDQDPSKHPEFFTPEEEKYVQLKENSEYVELLRELKMSNLIDGAIHQIKPTKKGEQRRLAILSHIRCVVRKSLGAQVYPHGSFALKTYFPDDDLDVSAFFSQAHESTWIQKLINGLCQEAEDTQGSHSRDPLYLVKRVDIIFSRPSPVVRCLIGEKFTVNIHANQLSALGAAALYENMDQKIGKDHLFKRTVLLAKAWARKNDILGSKGLSKDCLRALVFSLFNAFSPEIQTPLEGFYRLLTYLESFDWDQKALSAFGPLEFHSATFKTEPISVALKTWPAGWQPLVSPPELKKYMIHNSKPKPKVVLAMKKSLSAPRALSTLPALTELPTIHISNSTISLPSLIKQSSQDSIPDSLASPEQDGEKQHLPTAMKGKGGKSKLSASAKVFFSKQDAPVEVKKESSEEELGDTEVDLRPLNYTPAAINILDPVDPSKNLGATISYKYEYKIKGAFTAGARAIREALDIDVSKRELSAEKHPILCLIFPNDILVTYQNQRRLERKLEKEEQSLNGSLGGMLSSSSTSPTTTATSAADVPTPVTAAGSALSGDDDAEGLEDCDFIHHGEFIGGEFVPLEKEELSSSTKSAKSVGITETAKEAKESSRDMKQKYATLRASASSPSLRSIRSLAPKVGLKSALKTSAPAGTGGTLGVSKKVSPTISPVPSLADIKSDTTFCILDGNLEKMLQNLSHARQFQTPDISEEELVQLIKNILLEKGSVPVGRMGSLLHEVTNNHSLPAMVKEHYGGLKRLLERHPEEFTIGKDHPYNPHVRIRAPSVPSFASTSASSSSTSHPHPPPTTRALSAGSPAPRGSLSSITTTPSPLPDSPHEPVPIRHSSSSGKLNSGSAPHASSPPIPIPLATSGSGSGGAAESLSPTEERNGGRYDSSDGQSLTRARKRRTRARHAAERKVLTPCLAMDCEMVGVGPLGVRSILARCTIINYYGDIVYDKYVKPVEAITDFRTEVSGIQSLHVHHERAVEFKQVQREVAAIIKNRILIGHSLANDLQALVLSHPKQHLRDTAHSKLLCPRRPLPLKQLMKEKLGSDIQVGNHDSVEDARAALALYRAFKTEWEKLYEPAMPTSQAHLRSMMKR